MASCWQDDCGREFAASRSDAHYCSSACRQKAYRERHRLLSSDNVERVIAGMPVQNDYAGVLAEMLRETVTDKPRG